MYKILIPDGGEWSELTLSVMMCLNKADINVKIYVMSRLSDSHVRWSKYCEEFFHFETLTDKDFITAVKAISIQLNVDCIFPVSEKGIKLISLYSAYFCEYSFPPLSSPENIDCITDKWMFSEALKKYGIESPRTIKISNDLDSNLFTSDTVNTITFPAILKPRSNSGSGKGIQKLNSLEELTRLKSNEYTGCILQEYIEGYDIDCSVLCDNGRILAYTIQVPIYLDSDGFDFSRSIRFINDDQAINIVSSMMAAFRWHGVAHIDMRYCVKTRKIYIIEINARYWGSLLGSLSAGVNFPYLALQLAVGSSFEFKGFLCREYYMVGQYLRYKLRYYSQKKVSIKFQDTNYGYLLADPMPKIVKKIQAIAIRLKRKGNHSL